MRLNSSEGALRVVVVVRAVVVVVSLDEGAVVVLFVVVLLLNRDPIKPTAPVIKLAEDTSDDSRRGA